MKRLYAIGTNYKKKNMKFFFLANEYIYERNETAK